VYALCQNFDKERLFFTIKDYTMATDKKVIDGLLNILCDRKILTQEDTEELKKEFAKDETEYFEDYLIDERIVEKEDLLKALQDYYNTPAIDVMGAMFDHDLLVKFPKDVLLRNCCIPYYQDGMLLFVITNDPTNENLDEILGESVSYDFVFLVGIPRHIDMMIKDFYNSELYKDDFEDVVDEAERESEIVNLDEEGNLNLDKEGHDDGDDYKR